MCLYKTQTMGFVAFLLQNVNLSIANLDLISAVFISFNQKAWLALFCILHKFYYTL